MTLAIATAASTRDPLRSLMDWHVCRETDPDAHYIHQALFPRNSKGFQLAEIEVYGRNGVTLKN